HPGEQRREARVGAQRREVGIALEVQGLAGLDRVAELDGARERREGGVELLQARAGAGEVVVQDEEVGVVPESRRDLLERAHPPALVAAGDALHRLEVARARLDRDRVAARRRLVLRAQPGNGRRERERDGARAAPRPASWWRAHVCLTGRSTAGAPA